MKLRQLIGAFRQDLNDENPAGTLPNRWTDEQLLRYFNEGLCQVFDLKPEEYVEPILMELDVGTVQKLCNCHTLTKILGQTDETGAIVRPIAKYDAGLVQRWNKPVCVPAYSEFTLRGYTFSAADNGYFNVYPPVPPNEKVYIKALCSNPPDTFTMDDLDTEVDDCLGVTAARQWVLYSALMMDDESDASINAARVHLELFFNILKVQMTQQQLEKAGATNK